MNKNPSYSSISVYTNEWSKVAKPEIHSKNISLDKAKNKIELHKTQQMNRHTRE